MPPYTTSFLLSNLHCPSCVSHIKEALSRLDPQPVDVSPSLVTCLVTVLHEEALSVQDIQRALEQSGFDISDVTTDSKEKISMRKSHSAEDIGYLDRLIYRLGSDDDSAKSRARYTHLQNCEACRQAGDGLSDDGPSDSKKIPKPKITHNGLNILLEDTRANAMSKKDPFPLVVIDPAVDETVIWRASIAIGGMTCAACSGAITKELEKRDWIRAAVVNLISNSATVDFVGEDHKAEIAEIIEDIGYDATVDSVVNTAQIEQNGM
jgi:copper chaperone CopZ